MGNILVKSHNFAQDLRDQGKWSLLIGCNSNSHAIWIRFGLKKCKWLDNVISIFLLITPPTDRGDQELSNGVSSIRIRALWRKLQAKNYHHYKWQKIALWQAEVVQLKYGVGSQKKLDTMKFTHIDINFDVTYEGHQKPSKCQWKVFWPILITFMCDVKIDVKMCEPHYANLFIFVNLLQSPTVQFFDIFLTIWHLLNISTHYLNHFSQSQGYFTDHNRPTWSHMASLLKMCLGMVKHLKQLHEYSIALKLVMPPVNSGQFIWDN